MRRKKKEIKLESMEDFWPPKWFFAYSDLATLMMTFFLILATMVSLNIPTHLLGDEATEVALSAGQIKKIQKLAKLDQRILDMVARATKTQAEAEVVETRANEVDVLYQRLKEFIDEKDLQDEVSIERLEWIIDLNLSSAILFPGGRFGLSRRGGEIADQLAEFLRIYPCKIIVEGHTDDRPISTPMIPSNWELSVARANSFMRRLVEKNGIDPHYIEAIGYGEYRPLASNDGEGGRSRNRRLTIKLTSL
ncbi:MAG: OmpA family protein [Candidatus Omnitrophota bacterium]